MSVRVFTSKLIRQALSEQELKDLKDDFKTYKSGDGIPKTFGRDALYDHPHTYPLARQEEIQHIHLADSSYWPVHALQFQRTSDEHLVYCQGIRDENCYLLIQVLRPDAHNQARNNNVMHMIATEAGRFRDRY